MIFGSNFTLPSFASLSPYWQKYFRDMDASIEENFWGNLMSLRAAERSHDPYIHQQKEMGYSYIENLERPASFYQALEWVFKNLNWFLIQRTLTPADILWPAKVFALDLADGRVQHLFVPVGEHLCESAREVNILEPEIFVDMVASGFFPIGSSFRAHTNQTLAEHDLAHFAGFISCPEYMRAIREAFRRVQNLKETNPQVRKALNSFNSVYSIRLYYMLEVLTWIREDQRERVQKLIEYPMDKPLVYSELLNFLLEKAKNPGRLSEYLYRIYDAFPTFVNPLGGESRDIINRTRKFNRGSRLGTFYTDDQMLSSKFDGSSIYSLYQNGIAALENKRSSHPRFLEALRDIHGIFIAAIIGTSQLKIEEWVLQGVEEAPDTKSKLYYYFQNSGMWKETHMIYRAHTEPDCTMILTESGADAL